MTEKRPPPPPSVQNNTSAENQTHKESMSHKAPMNKNYTDIYHHSKILRFLPAWVRPYGVLARWDRAVGYMLLWIPTVWGLLLGYHMYGGGFVNVAGAVLGWGESLAYAILFLVGAIAMRGAGCTWNDMADIEYDKRVERTKSRPLASGVLTKQQALWFIILQCSVGGLVWLGLPFLAKVASILAILPALIYPFMKRITHYPQAWLGLTFNWGIWVGWFCFAPLPVTPEGALVWQALWIPAVLHLGAVFWTVGYDTIYAHQDRADDIKAGVKSTAVAFGARTKRYVSIAYGVFFACVVMAGALSAMPWIYHSAVAVIAGLVFYDLYILDTNDKAKCLAHFKYNTRIGLYLCIAMAIGIILY